MRRFYYTEGDCPGFIEMHAEWSGEGDNDTTVIAFSQSEGNGVGLQTFEVVGAIEWNEFVRAIRNLDLARKGEPPLPSRFDENGDALGDGADGVIAAR